MHFYIAKEPFAISVFEPYDEPHGMLLMIVVLITIIGHVYTHSAALFVILVQLAPTLDPTLDPTLTPTLVRDLAPLTRLQLECTYLTAMTPALTFDIL